MPKQMLIESYGTTELKIWMLHKEMSIAGEPEGYVVGGAIVHRTEEIHPGSSKIAHHLKV